MEKITLLLFAFFIVLQSLAQNPDPELFKTWNLNKIEVDFGGAVYVEDIDPPIYPYLTINQDMSFEGYGACNSFSGNFEFVPSDNKLRPINYSQTSNNCQTEFLNDFETVYFEFFSIEDDYSYVFYTDTTDNLRHMYFTNNPFGILLDFIAGDPLSIAEDNSEKFELYPNPASDQLFIKANKAIIEKTTVYSVSGQRVMEILPNNRSIDIAALAKGMYFLEITTSECRSVEKFIKK
jgi:heat shock protein HslJ